MPIRLDREQEARLVHVGTITEVLRAAHLTALVQTPWKNRGGIMLVSPPQQLKTSMIESLNIFTDVCVLSDLNAQKMSDLRTNLLTNRFRTIAFVEVNKLYQRNVHSAANLEGIIQSVVAEGWTGAPTALNTDMALEKARCLIVGGMTRNVYERRYMDWRDNGFLQRFLWCNYRMYDYRAICEAIIADKPIALSEGLAWGPLPESIPMNLTESEQREILAMLENHPAGDSSGIPFALMKKIAIVLKWRYERLDMEPSRHMEVLAEFSRMLGTYPALLDTQPADPYGLGLIRRQQMREKKVRGKKEKGVEHGTV